MTDKILFINNQWEVGKGRAVTSLNPATGEELWSGLSATTGQMNMAVEAARTAFSWWYECVFDKRVDIINKFKMLLKQKREDLARTISLETGKPLWETFTEVDSMCGKVDISIQAYHERTGTKENKTPGAKSIIRHKPHGVVAVFGPYNFPGHLPNGHIVPSLLAGNTIVFKPSKFTPLVARQTVELWEQAGLPPGVINLIVGKRDVGTALANHEGIDGLFFTGSTYTGQILHRQFAGQVQKILALEMGGNNPLIVTNVSDLSAAVYFTILSAYLSAGQRCTCARRLLVPKNSRGDEFIARLVESIEKIKVGFFDDEDQPFMGSVISEADADGLIGTQEKLTSLGGISLISMKKLKEKSALLSPGLMDVTAVNALPDEEYFGPFLQLIRYNTFDDAIKIANNTRFGLAAGLLCDDQKLYKSFYTHIRAGIVNWNRPITGASSAAPFGGIGISGNHHPSAYYAADYCSYPVASLESKSLRLPDTLNPGITLSAHSA